MQQQRIARARRLILLRKFSLPLPLSKYSTPSGRASETPTTSSTRMAACAILYQKREGKASAEAAPRRHHVAAYFKTPTKRKRERPPPSSVFSFAGAEERRQSVRPSAAEEERKQYTTPPHRPSENSQRSRERERGRLTFSPVILAFFPAMRQRRRRFIFSRTTKVI